MGLIIDANQVPAGAGRFPGVSGQPLMNADSGSPTVSMSILSLEPGGELPVHIHVDAESFFVLEGSGIVSVGGADHVAGPHVALLAAGGETHGFRNHTDKPWRILCMHPVGKPQTKFLS